MPEVKARSWTVFGKGQREDLDEDDAAMLVGRIRERLGVEIERIGREEGWAVVREMFGVGGEDQMRFEEGEAKEGNGKGVEAWEQRWSKL